ncbi:hypothetical protein [Roseixanthobacter liquoris]|uniref:hypothetical protein n=1 Tax=Roseixanthobacter liquoris TaxID=3119921 RepID=UPI00372667F1
MRPKPRQANARPAVPPSVDPFRPRCRRGARQAGTSLPPGDALLPPGDALARCRAARLLAAAFVHVPPQALEGTRGAAPVRLARHVALYVAHVTLGVPRGTVAVHFGRDRTSIAYACARMEQRRDTPDFDRALSALEACAAQAIAQGVPGPVPRPAGVTHPVPGEMA